MKNEPRLPRVLARLAGELELRIEEFQSDVLSVSSSTRAILVAGRGAYLYLLGAGIHRFFESGAKLQLLTGDSPGDSPGTLDALQTGRAHLGVTVLPRIPAGYKGELIREVRPHLIVRKDHPLVGHASISIARLSDLPLVLPPSPSPMRDGLGTIFEHEGHSLNVVLEATGWELMMHFASLGLGAAIVNGCCRPPRGTVAIPIRSLPPTRYFLVHTSDLYFSQDLRNLYQYVRDSAKGAPLLESCPNT